jgi:hypothetical protein
MKNWLRKHVFSSRGDAATQWYNPFWRLANRWPWFMFFSIRIEWKLENFWIGALWKVEKDRYNHNEPHEVVHWDLWICILPCLPIHVSWSCSCDPEEVPF